MPRGKTLRKKSVNSSKKHIEQYDHKDKQRVNNPPVGLVTPDTDKAAGQKKYAYDPHLDPQLAWAGKAEHTSFEVPTVSLHVHERIDPATIVEAVKRQNGDGYFQESLFNSPSENRPIREAIQFYKHKHNWTNRLIAGDSLLVMNSLIEKEGMAGQVQMVYIDPPYGIKYGSNFQPFVNKRDVKDGRDEDLTQEPEMVKAFRDTWELGIHSYLTYVRDRLLLAKELLTESGSIFVQISDENLHHVREIMDEVFNANNFVGLINYATTTGLGRAALDKAGDYLVWYAKDKTKIKCQTLYLQKNNQGGDGAYRFLELEDGSRRPMSREERDGFKAIPRGARIFRYDNIVSQSGGETGRFPIKLDGATYRIDKGSWKTNAPGIEQLKKAKRLGVVGNTLSYIRYVDDFPFQRISNMWTDTTIAGFASDKKYVVQTSPKVVLRCLLMATDPGDLVFDPTCGSGTTAYVAEQWGRRWVTCDTSRVATTLAKQRLMTSVFDYYQLAHPQEGVGSGFKYKTVPHITLKSIANNEPPGQETIYDQPFVDNLKARITGPFTVEAVPAAYVKPIDEIKGDGVSADASVARTGETLRQSEWRSELLKTGIRGKGGQKIDFSRVEVLSGTRWLHADAETKGSKPERAVVSFGPEHAPFEQRQVARALEEAQELVPKPKLVIFASFQFDPEAAKDIDETEWPGVTLLKVQMNTDLLTEDLKKSRSNNESFWLMGQPDVRLEKIKSGEDKGKYRISVHGFDYFNTITGVIESGGTEKIAMWLLDPDYDGRSLFPRQVFFPMAGEGDGWARLAKNLKAEIDEDLIEKYRGAVSVPFEAGANKRVAIKIVDDRGIESLKIIEIE